MLSPSGPFLVGESWQERSARSSPDPVGFLVHGPRKPSKEGPICWFLGWCEIGYWKNNKKHAI